MLKVTFKNPQFLHGFSKNIKVNIEALFIYCENVKLTTDDFGNQFLEIVTDFKETLYGAMLINIQSIEHVKPTEI